jgi:hypothetical protein
MVVAKITTSDRISSKACVVIYKLGILLICGGTGLSDRLTRAWPISSNVITLYVLHHNLWLKLKVLSLL